MNHGIESFFVVIVIRIFPLKLLINGLTPGEGYSHYSLAWGGSGLFEGPAKDYQMAQFRERTLPLGVILVVTTL